VEDYGVWRSISDIDMEDLAALVMPLRRMTPADDFSGRLWYRPHLLVKL
jgi:hypothetical protein